jgi:hypothetical protein
MVKLSLVPALPVTHLQNNIPVTLDFSSEHKRFLNFNLKHIPQSFMLVEMSRKKGYQLFISQKF